MCAVCQRRLKRLPDPNYLQQFAFIEQPDSVPEILEVAPDPSSLTLPDLAAVCERPTSKLALIWPRGQEPFVTHLAPPPPPQASDRSHLVGLQRRK